MKFILALIISLFFLLNINITLAHDVPPNENHPPEACSGYEDGRTYDGPTGGYGGVSLRLCDPDFGDTIVLGYYSSIPGSAFNIDSCLSDSVSICTPLEPEENEAVIDYLLGKHENAKLEEIYLKLKRSPPILEFESREYNPEIKKCLRIWPQDNDTEGFFVAKLKKN